MIMSITSSTQINQREMIDNDEEIALVLRGDNSPLIPEPQKKETDHIIRVEWTNFENEGTIYLIEKYMVALY